MQLVGLIRKIFYKTLPFEGSTWQTLLVINITVENFTTLVVLNAYFRHFH